MKTKEMATRAQAWGAVMLMILILIMVQGITSGVNAQEGGAQVDPEIQKKSQSDLQALTSFLTTPAPMMMKAMGVSSIKNVAEVIANAEKPAIPAWLNEELLKTEQGREKVMMEILMMKNQVFQVFRDENGNELEMPESRRQMNVESFLSDLRLVMAEEEFRRLASNEELLKQLDLFVEEASEDR